MENKYVKTKTFVLWRTYYNIFVVVSLIQMYYSHVMVDIEHPLLVKDPQLSFEQQVIDYGFFITGRRNGKRNK